MNDQCSDPPSEGDPFLEEVRRLKREAFARSGDDFDRHFERLREIQRKHPGGVASDPATSPTSDEKDAA